MVIELVLFFAGFCAGALWVLLLPDERSSVEWTRKPPLAEGSIVKPKELL
jgi:hypothetical protein